MLNLHLQQTFTFKTVITEQFNTCTQSTGFLIIYNINQPYFQETKENTQQSQRFNISEEAGHEILSEQASVDIIKRKIWWVKHKTINGLLTGNKCHVQALRPWSVKSYQTEESSIQFRVRKCVLNLKPYWISFGDISKTQSITHKNISMKNDKDLRKCLLNSKP